MKKSFSSHREVAHIWAQQSQAEGRASRVFFEGPSIYSYGHHFEMARFVKPKVVIFNSKSYSSSTSKHQYLVLRALSEQVTIHRIENLDDYNASLKSLIFDLGEFIQLTKRSNSNFEAYYSQINIKLSRIQAFIKEFKKDLNKKLIKEASKLPALIKKEITPELMEKKAKANKVREAKNAVKIEERNKIDEEQRKFNALGKAERLELWLKGTINASYYSSYGEAIALRIKNNQIQTTQGANVPLIEARKLWHLIEAKQPIEGVRVGHYTVTGIQGRDLVVGCHNIPLIEIYKLAKQLNWMTTGAV